MMAANYRISRRVFNYSSEKRVKISPEICRNCIFSCAPTIECARIKCTHNHPNTELVGGNNGITGDNAIIDPNNGGNNSVWICRSFATMQMAVLKLLQDAKKMKLKTVKPSDLPIVRPVSEEEISKIFEKLESKKLIKIQNKKKGVRQ